MLSGHKWDLRLSKPKYEIGIMNRLSGIMGKWLLQQAVMGFFDGLAIVNPLMHSVYHQFDNEVDREPKLL